MIVMSYDMHDYDITCARTLWLLQKVHGLIIDMLRVCRNLYTCTSYN